MATTRLSDVFIHDVYGSYTAVNNPETSAFFQAGIVTHSEVYDQLARTAGKQFTVPFWQDLDPDIEPNYSNDDPDDMATPNKVETGTMTARKAWLNQGYSEMDLVVELNGAAPLEHVRNRFGTYWLRQWERRLIATARGVMNDNIANDGGDMVIDISTQPGDAGVFGSDAFIDAAYTAGDRAEMFRGISVHSSIMARMLKNDEIVYIPDSSGGLTIPTYKGRVVIVDDMMPVVNGVFTSILFGAGSFAFGGVDGSAFAFGEGVPKVPYEVERVAAAGNGGGMETLWERKTWMLHPFGMEWVEPASPGLPEFSPRLVDLADGQYWNRVVPRKSVPLAFIISRANAVTSP